MVGPLVRRLRTFPRLQGLVVGAFGEGSEDLHHLVSCLADSRERYVANSSGYALSERERSQIIGQIRRRLSTSFIRAIALCTINRAAYTGLTAQAAADRRAWEMRLERGMRLERRAYWNAFVNGGGMVNGGVHFFPG